MSVELKITPEYYSLLQYPLLLYMHHVDPVQGKEQQWLATPAGT